MVNMSQIQAIHEKIMYTDRCTIFEYITEDDDDGALVTHKGEIPQYDKIACHISYSLRIWDNFDKKNKDKTHYEKQPKLFISNNFIVAEGSYAIAEKLDEKGNVIATYQGQVNIGSVCKSHQEFLIDVRSDA